MEIDSKSPPKPETLFEKRIDVRAELLIELGCLLEVEINKDQLISALSIQDDKAVDFLTQFPNVCLAVIPASCLDLAKKAETSLKEINPELSTFPESLFESPGVLLEKLGERREVKMALGESSGITIIREVLREVFGKNYPQKVNNLTLSSTPEYNKDRNTDEIESLSIFRALLVLIRLCGDQAPSIARKTIEKTMIEYSRKHNLDIPPAWNVRFIDNKKECIETEIASLKAKIMASITEGQSEETDAFANRRHELKEGAVEMISSLSEGQDKKEFGELVKYFGGDITPLVSLLVGNAHEIPIGKVIF